MSGMELTGVYAEIAELIGPGGETVALKLAGQYGGSNVYFPRLDALKLADRNRRIRERFTGDNYAQLAREFGLSVNWVRAIVKAGKESPRDS